MFRMTARMALLRIVGMLWLAGLCGAPLAQSVADTVSVTDPYIRAVPPVVKTSAAFMQLRNGGTAEAFLVAATTPVAGAVELHMHEHDEGVMRMRRIPHIHLPPAEDVRLEPGGLHVMLFDLQTPLVPGQEVPITLIFGDQSSKEVTASVKSVTKGMMKH